MASALKSPVGFYFLLNDKVSLSHRGVHGNVNNESILKCYWASFLGLVFFFPFMFFQTGANVVVMTCAWVAPLSCWIRRQKVFAIPAEPCDWGNCVVLKTFFHLIKRSEQCLTQTSSWDSGQNNKKLIFTQRPGSSQSIGVKIWD